MKGKFMGLLGIVGLIFFLLAIFPSIVFAGEYIFIYKFEQPVVRDLGNGSQIVELEDTRQNDAVIGAPLLPVRGAKIFIPAEEKVTSISVNPGALISIEGTYTIQHATTPYPTSYQGPIKLDEPDPDIYSTDDDYPSVIQVERGSQYLCGVQIVMVDLSPVVYYPVLGQLNYYEQIEITIITEYQGRPDGVMPFRNLPADRKQILGTIDNKNEFLLLKPLEGVNSTEGSAEPEVRSPGDQVKRAAARDYVVITTSGMISAFTNLTNHRQSAAGGSFTTHIEDIANILTSYTGVDDAEKMRKFIKDMYTNYGTKYVVLGGDCDGVHGSQTISTRGCYAVVGSYADAYIPSDLYFGCLDGTWNNDGDGRWGESTDGVGGGDIDWQSEVYVGRIPADSATEATEQINKIIAYETGTPPFKTLLVGEKLDSTPTWGGDRMDWVYGYMSSMPNTKLYDKNGTWAKATLLSHINSNNHNWLNHLGHGNATWNMKLANADVASMTNTQYFFHYTQACYSGSIDGRTSSGSYIGGDCILEDVANSNNHGGFAIIGNSRYGWYNSGSYVSGASNLAHKEFVEAIFTDGYKKLGEANQRSKTDLNLNSGVYRWIAFETNLLGCPVTEMVAPPTRILWDQPVSGTDTNAYACQDFETSSNSFDIWNGDDFTNGEPWTIDTIYVPGNTWNFGCHLTCATSLNFYIYADSSGVPAGYPDGGLGGSGTPVWRLSVAPSDSQVNLSTGVGGYQSNVTLNLTSPINLPPGTYWFLFYPEMSFTTCCQWGSHVSDTTNGYEGKVINPGNGFGHGATSWTNMTTFHSGSGLTKKDWAFRFEGTKEAAVSDELAADFGASGLRHYDGTAWSTLSTLNPSMMEAWDNNNSLAAKFSIGLYSHDGSGWDLLTGLNAEGMEAWSSGLAVDLGSSMGLWSYDGSSWSSLTMNNPEDMANWTNGLAVDFGSFGLWNFNGSSWSALTTLNCQDMESWAGGLAVDFGSFGLWSFDGSSWSSLTTNSGENMVAWSGGLAVDFGSFGLWNYNGSSWTLLTTLNAGVMEAWANGLAVSFASGLWNYNGSSWSLLTTNTAQDMQAWASELAVDFGSTGLWNYDGSTWDQLTSLNSEDMTDVDLY